MDDGGSLISQIVLLLPLIAAAVGWYIASRLAVFAVASRGDASFRRGASQAMPVLVVALIAIVRHQPQLAIGAVFGSCVAALSLVLGVVTFTSPPTQIAGDERRRWGFVLPAVLLVFLAGYQSHFTLLHAGVLALEGLVLLAVWREREPIVEEAQPVLARAAWFAPTLMAIAVAICVVAGLVGVFGATRLLERSSLPSMSIIAALLLGPALVIAMIGEGATMAQKGQHSQMVSSVVAFVVVCLCVVLPLIILVRHVELALPAQNAGELWSRLMNDGGDARLMFPLIVWRVDCVMLLVLGLALLPMSLGRWIPGRAEGLLLIAFYLVYMMLWRWASQIG